METIEFSGIIGMVALGALAANFLVGICIWSNMTFKIPYGISFLQLHKFTGYTAAITILLHIVLIPLDPASGFTWGDLLLPAWTEHQPLANTFGSIAFYLMGVVIVSSYYKSKIKLKTWRTLHYISYFAIVPLTLHSIITDPKLKDRPIDWFDAEKLFCIFCCVAILGFATYRWTRKEPAAGG